MSGSSYWSREETIRFSGPELFSRVTASGPCIGSGPKVQACWSPPDPIEPATIPLVCPRTFPKRTLERQPHPAVVKAERHVQGRPPPAFGGRSKQSEQFHWHGGVLQFHPRR